MSLFDNLFGKKKITKEIKETETALSRRPNDSNLLKKLGDLYLKTNNHESAADIYVRLGDTYNDKGFYPKAIALYKQAQKINPSWAVPLKKLAELYQVQGFAREAATQYVKLSELMEKVKEHEKATMYMQKAAELDPVHKKLNKKLHSFDVREKAMLETTPGSGKKPELMQTEFFDLNQELDKEIDELSIDETVEITEDDTGVDSVFRAIKENAEREGANDPLFLYNMGLAYRETGLLDEAIESFQKVIETGEKLFDAYVMLGMSLRENGKHEESLQAHMAGAALEDVTPDMKIGLLYEIGQTYKAMGDGAQALNIFREIQKEHKSFKDVDVEIARLAGGG
ncbi:MAG: tetratricopeptide repeat protein [Deltaproteobacteria bacterium]|nr:tetratricopeptide repeat protein [Deltaproteobacteria bacterium]